MTRTASRQRLPVYPTYTEVHRLLDACENERDRMLISLLWHTGGRVSEVLQARVGDITDNGIRLCNLKRGPGAAKHVYLTPGFLIELRNYIQGKRATDYIITNLNSHKPITRVRAWQIIVGASLRAGIIKTKERVHGDGSVSRVVRPLWTHSLRHGNAIRLLESDVPISVVQQQLGHADLTSTTVYVQFADKHRKALVQNVQF